MKRNWTYEKHPTKYPDLFTYQILEPNENYGKVGGFSRYIKQFGVCDLDSEENTKLIIKAVNNYEVLLEALRETHELLNAEINRFPNGKERLQKATKQLFANRELIKQAEES